MGSEPIILSIELRRLELDFNIARDLSASVEMTMGLLLGKGEGAGEPGGGAVE